MRWGVDGALQQAGIRKNKETGLASPHLGFPGTTYSSRKVSGMTNSNRKDKKNPKIKRPSD